MNGLNKNFNNILSHIILVFPPEVVKNDRFFCRFEPDGIAILKGFLQDKGMRFVDLVYSPVTTLDSNIDLNIKNSFGWTISVFDQEGISLRSIANSALNESFDSSIALSLSKLLTISTLPNTKIIGFSIGFPSQFYHSLILARIAKQLNPDLFVVLGGPMITSFITFIITIDEITSIVDGIIPGYGEEPLAQLLLCLEDKKDLKNVPNLYLSNTDGFQLNANVWKPDKSNLLTIPNYGRPTLHREFDPNFPIRPSIGCYWGKCAFCVYPSMPTGTLQKHQYIVLKPEELVEHINGLIKKGSGSRFELCSDSLPPAYLKKFSEEILKSKLEIKWSAWSCVDKRFADNGVLEMMKQSGCECILLGVESASQRVLKRMNKMQTRQDIDLLLNAFSLADIGLFLTLFIGFPGETKEEAMETIEFLKDLIVLEGSVNKVEVRLYRFALMGNTPIAENFEDYGISSIDWSDMYYLDDDFSYHYEVSEGMSFKEIKDFVTSWRLQLGLQTNDSPFIQLLD